MANIVKFGSILLDGVHTNPGSEYQPDETIDFADGNSLSWVVVNGLLIADRPLLVNISWDDLDAQGFVAGKEVEFNGQEFLCRLLSVGAKRGDPNKWDAALDAVGDDDEIWHWENQFFWGQESVGALYGAFRGYRSARYWDYFSSSYRDTGMGFRPALEPLPSDNLVSGTRVCAIGGQSVLHGRLLETTNYDAIIQPEPGSMMAETDGGKFYTTLPNGTVILDRASMVVQTIKEK